MSILQKHTGRVLWFTRNSLFKENAGRIHAYVFGKTETFHFSEDDLTESTVKKLSGSLMKENDIVEFWADRDAHVALEVNLLYRNPENEAPGFVNRMLGWVTKAPNLVLIERPRDE